MIPAANPFKKLVLVCSNDREGGENCCKMRGSELFFPALKLAIKAECPGVRVSRSGCLGNCLTGPTVVIMPDNVWLGEVREADIPLILELVKK